ncbi:MAG: SpoIIIAH-like family protein [Clostridia bacterium]|nr:SpoIIIAH-like family protein [Clostridia bacterium]
MKLKSLKTSKKRSLIMASLVLSLATAVYLNWQFSSEKDTPFTDEVMSTKELGQAQFVNNAQVCESNIEAEDVEQDKDVKDRGYFDKAKTDRQKARDESTETIKEILDDTRSTEETKAEAIKKAGEISKRIEQESNIENLIKAKGFAECLAFLQNDECSIVIGAGELNENTAIAIKDIVCGQAGISSDKIKVIQVK